jgi:hypothetical protein
MVFEIFWQVGCYRSFRLDQYLPFFFFSFFLEKRIQTSLPRLALASASRKSESYYNPSFEQMVSEPKVFAQNLVIVPVVSENHLQDSKKSREAN